MTRIAVVACADLEISRADPGPACMAWALAGDDAVGWDEEPR
jgi:hypothetical protein